MENTSKIEIQRAFQQTCCAVVDLCQKLQTRQRVSTEALNSLSRLLSALSRIMERGSKLGVFDDADQQWGTKNPSQDGGGPPIWNPNVSQDQ